MSRFTMPDFLPALPEMVVLAMACLILIIDLFLSDRARHVTYLLAQTTLIAALMATLLIATPESRTTFNGHFILDPMATLLKGFIYLSAFVSLLYARGYLQARGMFRGEFYLLALFAVLGMMVMVSAASLLTLYLGLELMSLALYALVALQRDSAAASEAAMKYFILGAIASAMLLYGMSMLYGLTGTLQIAEMGVATADVGESRQLLLFGLVFLLVGVAFKLGAVPFHMWVPDVYHGAPTAVTLLISTAPKLAAFAMLMRLLAEGLIGLYSDWQQMLILLTVASLAIGNIVAIAQANIKRMLAYSGISHIAFLLMGVLAGGASGGYAAGLFYVIVYALMGLASFGMVILLSRAGFEAERLDDYRGLSRRSPWFALMMLIVIFSLAGVPPFLGFWAKLAVLEALVRVDLVWLALVGVIFSVVGAFYYLRIIKLIYFDAPEDETPLTAGGDMKLVLSLNSLAILGIGLWPAGLMALCSAAV